MELEVVQFATAIGATEPSETDEILSLYRALFRERNYFRHPSGFLVIKISRSKKPFWGLTRQIMQALNSHFDYHLILLRSANQGWVFTKAEVIQKTGSKAWNLDSSGLQYKINSPLPDANLFLSPKHCLMKLGSN